MSPMMMLTPRSWWGSWPQSPRPIDSCGPEPTNCQPRERVVFASSWRSAVADIRQDVRCVRSSCSPRSLSMRR
ncbi:GD19647 [Drosophila simulans]|uniref:GD19647 n=1 Tax=Drosophila simulans TaxID=7240 RepID=B4QW60_DROSI|nr:GD19647 [Drosophila simulans]